MNNTIGIDPTYDYLYDPQQAPPSRWCPCCGGEIYGADTEVCANCAANDD